MVCHLRGQPLSDALQLLRGDEHLTERVDLLGELARRGEVLKGEVVGQRLNPENTF